MTFPSAEDVRALAETPAPEVDLEELIDTLYIEQWAMAEPLPTRLGDVPHEARTAWEKEVAAKTSSLKESRTSEAMHCMARQTAHFFADHGDMPPGAVNRFIAGRCGWVGRVPALHIHWWEGDDPERGWEQVGESFLDRVAERGTDGPVDFGIWAGAVADKTIVALAAADRTLTVRARSVSASGDVVIEGEVLDPRFEAISGLITSGEYDLAYCESDEAIRFPAFRIRCPMGSADKMAWFEFILHIKGQNWNNTGFAGLVWGSKVDKTYRAAPWRRAWAEDAARFQVEAQMAAANDASLEEGVEEKPEDEEESLEARLEAELAPRPLLGEHVIEGDTLEERIVSLTNIARAVAGRAPIALAKEQTRTNTALAPHFFQAQRNDDWTALDQLASAILAGWDVEGGILSAALHSGAIADGDGREMVDAFLEMPTGRRILLSEAVGQVAFGTLHEEDRIWTVVTGYKFVPKLKGEEMIATATATINAARHDAGLAPLADAERYHKAAIILSDAIVRGERTPGESAQRIMNAMSSNLNTRVTSWTILTDDLERIHLPDVVVTTPGLRA
ncbi:MAG: hypothetical protein ACNA8W_23940, partial [Bradymonadaceae bacterium]